MSISPGSRMASPRSMAISLSRLASEADDPVVFDRDDSRPDDLAGVDVK